METHKAVIIPVPCGCAQLNCADVRDEPHEEHASNQAFSDPDSNIINIRKVGLGQDLFVNKLKDADTLRLSQASCQWKSFSMT
jgi:hypothetical protein